MKLNRTTIAIASLLAVTGLATSADAFTLPKWLHRGEATATAPVDVAPVKQAAPIPPLPADDLPNFRAIVKDYGPAVVGVNVSGMHKVNGDDNDNSPFFDNDPFFRFFRGIPGLRMPPQGRVPFRGLGSGFIISPDGLILTNAHVVRDAKQVIVKLKDRREFTAKVLGSDAATDIAVLKIDAKDLPTVALGNPKEAQVGDWVLAIGAPYGFSQTATQGIVSAKGRSLPGDSVVPFIQTDAAVNPGNSGGPLFDAEGRVIGINAQIYSQSGGFQGLAFSIPIDVALRVKDQIVAHGHVDHARMGVTLQDLSAPLAESFGLKSPDGALIASVVPGSAAAKAELKPGDVITMADGKAVHTSGDVSHLVGAAAPGDKLTLSVWRNKGEHDVTVTLGKAEPENAQQTAQAQEGGALGLAVRPLQRDEMRSAGVDHGLLVERAGGAAAQAGIQPGDVVLALNGKPVSNVDQVREALSKHPKHVALLIDRDGQRIFVPVDLG
ncbi:MAG: Do family serine endopeptidase [Burkholderiaceae bacterium]|nr:Do family serine endopeptidase [Ideonella sp.]MCC7288096.1 Do family serine endopeptidase [Burkholderiaceae bacterium]